jgi:hypothetical protein
MDTVRETGGHRPTPEGDYDGHTRASLMKALLAKADAPEETPTLMERLLARPLAWLTGGGEES